MKPATAKQALVESVYEFPLSARLAEPGNTTDAFCISSTIRGKHSNEVEGAKCLTAESDTREFTSCAEGGSIRGRMPPLFEKICFSFPIFLISFVSSVFRRLCDNL